SSPFMPGSDTSTSTRSGVVWSKSRSASSASAACPTTSRSGSDESVRARPFRMRGWSSTTRMRVFIGRSEGGGGSAADRHRARDDGAALRERADLEGAPEDPRAVVHDTDAHPPVVVGAGGGGARGGPLEGALVEAVAAGGADERREARAVVAHDEPEAVRRPHQRDVDVAGLPVADGVGDGLLRDAEEVRRRLVREAVVHLAGVPRRLERARDAEE